MFANFTFDTSSSPSLSDTSNASSSRETSRSVSPCSPIGPFPLPRCSITDLAAQFDRQRIRKESQICYQPCDTYANQEDDAAWQLEPPSNDTELSPVSRSRSSLMQRSRSPSTRMARQANTRLLCSASHHQDIAALVARMVRSEEQCSVTPQEALTRTSKRGQEDEGYDSSEESSAATSRRSSVATVRRGLDRRRTSEMRSATGACVSKSARLKQDRQHRRKRSSEKS